MKWAFEFEILLKIKSILQYDETKGRVLSDKIITKQKRPQNGHE